MFKDDNCYKLNILKNNFYKRNSICSKSFITKEIFLERKKSNLMYISNIHDFLINLRKVILLLIENGVEFDIDRNLSCKNITQIENKTIIEILNIKKNNNIFDVIKIINIENDILVKNIPNALKRFEELKKNNLIYQGKFNKLNQYKK